MKNRTQIKQTRMRQVASKRYYERLIVCMINVIALWCSSLVMSSNIIHLFFGFPAKGRTQAAVSDAMALVEEQKAQYERCARDYEDLCNLTSQKRLIEENSEVARNHLSNDRIVNETYEQMASCYEGQSLMYNLISQQPSRFRARNVSPRIEDCSSLLQLSSLGEYNQAILESSSDYLESFNEAFALLETQVEERLDYDASFLAAKRLDLLNTVAQANILAANRFYQETLLREKLSRRLSCLLNSSHEESTCGHPSLADLADRIRVRAFDPLQTSYFRFADLSIDAKSGILDFMASLSRWSQTSGVQIIGGMPTFDANSRLSFIEHYTSRKVMDLREKFSVQASILDEIARENVLGVNAALESFFEFSLKGSLQDERRSRMLKVLLDGYSPPTVEFDPSLMGLKTASADFKSSIHQAAKRLEQTLNGTAEFGSELWARARESGRRIVEQDIPAISQVADAIRRPSIQFSFYDLSLDQILNLWDTLINCILIGDALFRLFQTVALLQKYWRASTTMAPLYDARSVVGIQRRGKPTPLQKVALILTHPAFLSLCSLAFAVVVGSFAVMLYAPMYYDYVKGCVLTQTKSKGTVFTRNSEAVLTLYASRKGAQQLNKVHHTYQTWAGVVCAQRTKETEAASNLLNEELLQYTSNILQARSRLRRVERCYHIPTSLVETYEKLINSTCSVDDHKQLLNDTFDCEGLGPYPNPCKGIDQGVIRASVQRAGCAVERVGHLVAVTYALSGITFVSLNICRILFIKGIILVFRHRLLPVNARQLLVNCSIEGFVLDMDYDARQDYFVREEAKRKRYGAMLLFLSWCTNLPWLFLAIYSSSTLQLSNID